MPYSDTEAYIVTFSYDLFQNLLNNLNFLTISDILISNTDRYHNWVAETTAYCY